MTSIRNALENLQDGSKQKSAAFISQIASLGCLFVHFSICVEWACQVFLATES